MKYLATRLAYRRETNGRQTDINIGAKLTDADADCQQHSSWLASSAVKQLRHKDASKQYNQYL